MWISAVTTSMRRATKPSQTGGVGLYKDALLAVKAGYQSITDRWDLSPEDNPSTLKPESQQQARQNQAAAGDRSAQRAKADRLPEEHGPPRVRGSYASKPSRE